MSAVSSLTNRIFLACTVVAALSLGFVFSFVNNRASSEAEEELRRGLSEAGQLVDEHRATLTDTFTRLARLIGDLPKLKAAVETGDPPTVQPLADEYAEDMRADVLVLTSPQGTMLGVVGETVSDLPRVIEHAGAMDEISTFIPHGRGLLHVVSVPLLLEGELPAVLGRLTAGFFLDDNLAAQFKGLTGSEIAFGAGGRIMASTLPAGRREAAAAAMTARDITHVILDDEEFLALTRPLVNSDDGLAAEPGAPVALILRSRTERLRFLSTIRNGLVAALALTVIVATLVSYGVARTMTRPLHAITSAMREMAATGDLTRRVSLKSRPWDDEDARLLASTYNTMTESIGRFQKEAAQKERLSALGRLSTIIAHEIRNPLMIIKSSLPVLRRDTATASEWREAIADIEDETTRLNRIVSEVLDFARPIRFDLAEANLNDICRASAAAAWAGAPGDQVRLDLDDAIPPLHTDAERLRTALVNLLANARHAVDSIALAGTGTNGSGDTAGRFLATPDAAPVEVRTRLASTHATVTIQDRGVGISPEDMAHIFDPYFTTRRAGTGLGLPISKNIIEGLGGTLVVTSRRGEGTQIRIDLPLARPGDSRMTPSTRGHILLVDDEEKILKRLGRALRDEGHEVVEATSVRDAQRHLGQRSFDLFVVDNLMPGTTGLELIRELSQTMTPTERPQIVMMTAHGSTQIVREAFKLGVEDFLEKPFELDELIALARRAVKHLKTENERQYLLSERDADFNHYGLVGRSRAMQEVIERAELVAETKSTVLITGETGTGKEMVARLIHHRSAQREMPLIKVNCAAIPETLLESELFGHLRGAFTGASMTKRGKFALADGGSIFLDEIGTLTLGIQAKLLRAIQEREFEPLGSERTVRVDVRVIAATNRDLKQMVSDGRFQEDLFYRLNVIPIGIPPLRTRRDDIPVLIEHFVEKHRQRTGKRIDRVEPDVVEALQRYDWPGNVRELENTIERAVVLATGPVMTQQSISLLGASSTTSSGLPSMRLHQNLEWVERETIRRALEQSGGIKKDAAEAMGISQRALSYYLAKYRID